MSRSAVASQRAPALHSIQGLTDLSSLGEAVPIESLQDFVVLQLGRPVL